MRALEEVEERKDEENERKGRIKRIRGKVGWRELEKRKYREDEEKE